MQVAALVARDAQLRTPPPVSLHGRPAPPPMPAPAPASPLRWVQPPTGVIPAYWSKPEPGDDVEGAFSRERLLEMDAKFCERMRRAIEMGLESPPVSGFDADCWIG
jgi:hypothetical protein